MPWTSGVLGKSYRRLMWFNEAIIFHGIVHSDVAEGSAAASMMVNVVQSGETIIFLDTRFYFFRVASVNHNGP